MEALGNILAPHSELLGKIAGGVASIQLISIVLLMHEIYSKGSSDVYSFAPFSIGGVLSVLTLKLGFLMGDAATIYTNLLGLSVNGVGCAVFILFASADKKKDIWNKISYSAAFAMACLAYASYEDTKLVEIRFGLIITLLITILVGAPLFSVPKIIRQKRVEGLHFPMIASGALTMFAWGLYGVSLRNWFMVYQNLFLLSLVSVQLVLFAIYPSGSAPVAKKLKSKKIN